MKTETTMNFIEGIRAKLNCGKREFARFLGCSRTLIDKADAGMAAMTSEGDKRLNLVYHAIRQYDKNTEAVKSENNEAAILRTQLKMRNLEIQVEINQLNTELANMTLKYENACSAIPYYQLALENQADADVTINSWLKAQLRVQLGLMNRYDLLARHAMKVKIAQLETELRMNKEALG